MTGVAGEGQGGTASGGHGGALQGGLGLGWGCLVPAIARGVLLLVLDVHA
jgi:hypothetical protein